MLLWIVSPWNICSNTSIVNSLVVMKMLIARHKEGKLKAETLKELIRYAKEKVYPGFYSTKTVSQKLIWYWGEVGTNSLSCSSELPLGSSVFRGWEKCIQLAEQYEYFEKMTSESTTIKVATPE